MGRIIIHLILIIISTCSYSHEYYLKNFSINEGLPSSESYCVFQDSKGFIWIGTDMGVSRYDGYTFKNFTTEDGLVDNTVFAFSEDSKGRIWFSSFSGKICYYLNDSIYGRNFPVNTQLTSFIGAGCLTGIREYKDDTLLLATSQGMLKVSPSRNKGINTWDNFEILNKNCSYFLKDGYVTVETAGNDSTHVTCYSGLSKVSEINLPSKRAGIISISGNPLEYIQINYSLCTYILYASGRIIKTDFIATANCSLPINKSQLWIGAERKGARLYSLQSNLQSFSVELLIGLSVSCIIRDKEDGYWFTTIEEGLFYMPSDKFTYFTVADKLIPTNRITGMAVTSKGLLITSATSILKASTTQPPTPFLSNIRAHLPYCQYFWDVYEYTPQELWLSTNGGIAIIDPVTKRLKNFVKKYNETAQFYLPSQQLLKDRKGYMWSLNSASILKIDVKTKEIVKIIPIPSRAQTMCEDNKGNILIGALNGMYRCMGDTLHYLGTGNSIYGNRFVDIKRFGDSLLVAASRGAGIFIIGESYIQQISTTNGLSSNMCRAVHVDTDNTIWVATNSGLNAVRINLHPFTINVQTFTVADGLLSNDVERVVKYTDNIWVYTKKGLTVFNPDSIARNDVPPPVYIKGLYIDNASATISAENMLSYKTNFIRIDFVGLTYKNTGSKNYKYKLAGYNDEWMQTNSTFVQFTKLPPGKYKFIVSCINNAGVESTQPAEFSFTISTPLYLRWWFIFLVAVVLTVAIVSLYIFNVSRIRKREKQKTEINSRIANLELQALQAQMNPHFIFNCLNAIQDFILKNDTQSATRYLNKFAKLIRNTLNNSRRQNIVLAEEIGFLNLYIGLEHMRFGDKFDYTVTATEDVRTSSIEIPSMIIQPFVENAIRHGQISHMDKRGNLEVNFSINEYTLVCGISDNGIGIKRSTNEKSSSGPRQAHALDIISERVKTINEIGRFVITYKMVDKSDMDKSDSGTYVEVRIIQKQKET